MHKTLSLVGFAGLLISGLSPVASYGAQAAPEPESLFRITVDTNKPGTAVSPLLYGVFFEDINRAADGGIYAEMIQNRSFEDSYEGFFTEGRRRDLGAQYEQAGNDAIAWSLVKSAGAEGSITLDRAQPLNDRNLTSLRLTATRIDKGARIGIANDGFRGIPMNIALRSGQNSLADWRKAFDAADNGGLAVEKGKAYDFSLYARALEGAGSLTVSLEKADGSVLAHQDLPAPSTGWQQYSATLTPSASDTKARLIVSTRTPSTYWLDMVSLFPRDTWHGRKNGLRADIMERIAAMKPAFVRFPGGCIVEGERVSDAFRWKDSVGDMAQRRGYRNIWGYYASNGLGYHEYLQMCEDLGAQPLFVINCGMAHRDDVPMRRMPEFVQDALDALEYANGPVTSTWGALRARNGHPKPFNLKLMEIGNENGGPRYYERYALFHDAIKAKDPDVQLIANDWRGVPTNRPLDLIDSHMYNNPTSFLQSATKYDTYDRKGPKVYFGEYAVTREGGRGNLRAAVAEAAFMTGLERNSDVVRMSSYAPLLERNGWRRWSPNAIIFDQSRAYGTPSYYVQAMFAANRPSRILPLRVESFTPEAPVQGMVGVGTWNTQAEFKDIKVTKGDQVLYQSNFSQGLDGWKTTKGQWKTTDGVLGQTGSETGTLALFGDRSWSNYTLTLKARKLGGSEGFLITFGAADDRTPCRWNLGGWGNTGHEVEAPGIRTARVPGTIETGRWYDIKIELQGRTANFYLDGQLIHTATRENPSPVYAIAGLDDPSGDTIIKVVNPSTVPVSMAIDMSGGKSGPWSGKALVLSSADPRDENSFESPTKVTPREEVLSVKMPGFVRTFPASSVTVLRLRPAVR
jgi:alpha-L-arabinofuranosidase